MGLYNLTLRKLRARIRNFLDFQAHLKKKGVTLVLLDQNLTLISKSFSVISRSPVYYSCKWVDLQPMIRELDTIPDFLRKICVELNTPELADSILP